MLSTNRKSESQLKQEKSEALLNGVSVWTSYYRQNPHRFVKDWLGINLRLFQQIILCMMFKYPNLAYIASRGIGKTFMFAVFVTCYAILYPGTSIRVASRTRGQASEVIKKIIAEILPKSEIVRMEIADWKLSAAEAIIKFHNGSEMSVVTSSENARGNRANILLIDEFRMLERTIIDSILKKFLAVPRQPGYLQKHEYKDHPRERNKILYASSGWFEEHWSYALVKDYVSSMLKNGSDGSHFCCSMPYQLARLEGLLDDKRIEEDMLESNFSEITFLMEMEGLFFGKSDGGLFNYSDIEKTRLLKFPAYPKSANVKLADKRVILQPKQPEEIRILSVDIALMAQTKNNKNDATSIFLNQMIKNNSGKYIYNIVYTENNEGLRTDTLAVTIRRLFYELNCDYLVIDCKGAGLSVTDLLMADVVDTQNGEVYPALSCCNSEEIAKRCLVKGAPKVIWAIQGMADFNSRCAMLLRDTFKLGQIRLLIPEFDMEDVLNNLTGYAKLNSGQKISLQLPYIHTELLINELVNLEYEVKNGIIKVKEKTGMRKDRYSSLSYNIFVAKEIEREQSMRQRNKIGGDLAFKFIAPKIK